MICRLIALSLVLLISFQGRSQPVTGVVRVASDNTVLPGANIVEKGTSNGTASDNEGKFSLNVTSLDDTLTVWFIGFLTAQVPLRGKDYVEVILKEDVYMDLFDAQQFALYASSGVVHTPAGLNMELTSPVWFQNIVAKVAVGYQTNFSGNGFLNMQAGLDHLFVSLKHNQDLHFNYNNLEWKDHMRMTSTSIQTDLRFFTVSGLTFTAGYSTIDFNDLESATHHQRWGPLIGLGKWIGRPINTQATVKASLYNGLAEYNSELRKRLKGRINLFARFYKLDTFTEISLGLGWQLTYYLPQQRIHDQ
ncbi:MAG TPA: carboxypeptidase-like regulatory domain-containing protein [Chryseolinea sp.]